MDSGKTHYDLLEVREDASLEVIKGAYKYLSQKWHPDRNSAFRDEAEQMSKRLNEAYAVLSDPAKRAEYDDCLLSLRGAVGAEPPTREAPKPVKNPKAKGQLKMIATMAVILAAIGYIPACSHIMKWVGF